MGDITPTLAANSDQLNAADIADPIRVQVERVEIGQDPKQPVSVYLAGHDRARPWRPCKTMRRLLARAWGTETDEWVGRELILYHDPTAEYGGKPVGGIRISHLSHLSGPADITLPDKRGKVKTWHVDPIPAGKPTTPPLEEVLAARELAPADLDAWLVGHDRTRVDDMKPAQAAKCAAWLTPARVVEIREWLSARDAPEPGSEG